MMALAQESQEEAEEETEEVVPKLRFGCGSGEVPLPPPVYILLIVLVTTSIVCYARISKSDAIQLKVLPSDLLAGPFGFSFGIVVGLFLLGLCVAVMMSTNKSLKQANSGIPFTPVGGIATTGLYAHTRNPIYVAFLFCLIPSFSLFFNSAWPLVLGVPFALYLHFCVVLVEERFLLENFGEEYEAYTESVPRWLC